MRSAVIGWDVGGANVKAARLAFADNDTVPHVVVRPFPLWRDPDRLTAILVDVGAELGTGKAMGITMTAELADCFASKSEGVRFVLDAFRSAFPHAGAWVYGLDGSFHALDDAYDDPIRFAAANWLATASWVARHVPDALLIDIGSTTTDIVPIVRGRVEARGRTDTERLALGELLYTGLLRTPVCALVRRVPLRGGSCRVAAEHFAIAADAHVWLQRIDPGEYTCETPDGRGTTRPDARRRLARVVCGDDASLTDDEITGIARTVVGAQMRRIATAVDEVLTRFRDPAPDRALIAGSGHRLAATIARRTGLDVVRLEDLYQCDERRADADIAGSARSEETFGGADTATAAPAAAVAWLLGHVLSCSPPVQG